MDKKALLEQQLNVVLERKRTQPKAVDQPKQAGARYNAALQRLVREVRKDVNQQLVPLLRKLAPEYQATDAVTWQQSGTDGTWEAYQPLAPVATRDAWFNDIAAILRALVDRWTSPAFRSIAEDIATQFVTTADQVNRKRFAKSLGVDLFGDAPELNEVIEAAIYDNTRLITSIPEQYLTQVESIVLTNVRAGQRPSAITARLSEQFGVTTRRAKMIARDQTAKVNGDLSKRRQTAAGFPYFQWIDSDDERVRDRHENIANKVTAYGKGIYRWDNPPLSASGQPIIPGQDYQCRCSARPVSQREVDENVKAGRTRPGVKR